MQSLFRESALKFSEKRSEGQALASLRSITEAGLLLALLISLALVVFLNVSTVRSTADIRGYYAGLAACPHENASFATGECLKIQMLPGSTAARTPAASTSIERAKILPMPRNTFDRPKTGDSQYRFVAVSALDTAMSGQIYSGKIHPGTSVSIKLEYATPLVTWLSNQVIRHD